jgi:hypothetical protein
VAKLSSPRDLERWIAYLQAQPLPVNVTCEKWKNTRSSAQNRYLFGVAYPPIAEATGYEVDDIHEYCLGRHFGWVDKPVPKTPRNPEGFESKPYRTTTTDENGKRNLLSKGEFAKFVGTVERVAAQAGAFIAERWEG